MSEETKTAEYFKKRAVWCADALRCVSTFGFVEELCGVMKRLVSDVWNSSGLEGTGVRRCGGEEGFCPSSASTFPSWVGLRSPRTAPAVTHCVLTPVKNRWPFFEVLKILFCEQTQSFSFWNYKILHIFLCFEYAYGHSILRWKWSYKWANCFIFIFIFFY